MKRKILTLILVILIIVFICIVIYKLNVVNKEENNQKDTDSSFMLNQNSIDKINPNGENCIIYVGTAESEEKENFVTISSKIDKTNSNEEQAKVLISEISKAIGYQIDINSVEIDENKIKVDFANTSAPFELEKSYLIDIVPKFYPSSNFVIPKAIFDSINKTFISYFGKETEVYFSVNSENINIQNDVLPISIDQTKPY